MFTIPRTNVIESDAGYSVEVLGRTGMICREGGRSAFVDSEVLAPGKGIAIFTDSIKKWDSASGEESIGVTEKERIITNIKTAMDFKKETLEIA
jgi:Immunity protein 74